MYKHRDTHGTDNINTPSNNMQYPTFKKKKKIKMKS